MQKKLCRPVPLETIGSLTVATLRELAADAGSICRSALEAAAADDNAPATKCNAPAVEAPALKAQFAIPEAESALKDVQTLSAVAAPKQAEVAPENSLVAQQVVAATKKVPCDPADLILAARSNGVHAFSGWRSPAEKHLMRKLPTGHVLLSPAWGIEAGCLVCRCIQSRTSTSFPALPLKMWSQRTIGSLSSALQWSHSLHGCMHAVAAMPSHSMSACYGKADVNTKNPCVGHAGFDMSCGPSFHLPACDFH